MIRACPVLTTVVGWSWRSRVAAESQRKWEHPFGKAQRQISEGFINSISFLKFLAKGLGHTSIY